MERRDNEVNGTLYSLLLPPVRQAMPLCTRTAALLGSVLGSLGERAGGEGMAKFAAALQAVDPAKVDALLMDAVRAVHLSANERPISGDLAFEQHFAERRGDVYPVSVWALWECVRDFFPDLASFAQKATTWAGAAFPSPTGGGTTTGSGG